MAFEMVEYERGQLVMIRHKYPNAKGREQQKDRPWLILSIGKFNESAGMFTAVPVTSQEKKPTPAHVKFFNTRRRVTNTIMCEQIRSFDYRCGDYIVEHLGVLSQEILEKVDVALSVHCGFHYSPITLDNLYKSMEAIVKSVGHMQKKAETPVFTDNDVQDFTTKLMEMAGKTLNLQDFSDNFFDREAEPAILEEPIRDLEAEYEMQDRQVIEELSAALEEEETTEPENPRKAKWMADLEKKKKATETKKRMKWTPEKMEEFLKDSEELPMSEVMKKWDITKRSDYYAKKHYVKNNMSLQK